MIPTRNACVDPTTRPLRHRRKKLLQHLWGCVLELADREAAFSLFFTKELCGMESAAPKLVPRLPFCLLPCPLPCRFPTPPIGLAPCRVDVAVING